MTYVFGADTTSREITVVNLAGQLVTKAITYISSWYLAKVISPDGKETITFNYNSGPNLSYEQFRNIITYNIHHECTDKRKGIFSSKVIHTETLSAINVQKIDVSTVINVLSPKYLSSIQNDMGSVTFSYNSRQDLAGGQALNQINIYNINDSSTPLKTYTFNESYFISPNSPSAPDSKRLRLDCVTLQGRSAETKQLFVFSYNEQVQLPPRYSDEFDHWGYYTTLNNRAGFPSANLTTDKDGNYDDGFERRVPDSVRVKACILTKVRNVNGGYTNLYYALDDYKFDGGIYTGGGLRIKTIIENDSLGQVVPIVKQYTYLLDDGTSSGMIYNHKPYYIQGITNYQAGTVVKPIPSLLSAEINQFKNPYTDIALAAEVALTIAGSVTPVGLAIDVGVLVLAPAAVDAFQFLFHRTHHYHYDSPSFAISSTPLNNLFDMNGASVTYGQVQIINGDGGKTINYYTSQQEYPDSASSVELNCLVQPVKPMYGNAGSYPPSTSFDFERGLLKQSKSYNNNNNLVSMLTNTYQLSKRVSVVEGQRSSVSGYAPLSADAFQVITYNFGLYKEISENIQLAKSVLILYDQDNSGNSLTTTCSYTWQSSYPTLMHSVSTPRSDGKLLVNYMTYPMEYASGTPFLDNMVSHYLLATPIERVSTLQDATGISITGGIVNRYKTGGLGLLDTVFSLSASKPILQANFKFANQAKGIMNGSYAAYSIDKSYIAKAFYQTYDSKNNLVQSQNIGEPSSSIIWGYNQDVPIAQISNATIDKVAYTSFETNDQRYWLFTATGRDSSALAKTGKVRYQLSSGSVSTTASIPSGTYILSLWTQGAKPTISGTTADVAIVNGESDNNSWNFYMDRVTVAGGAPISLTGSGLIDELRLYPQGAHMSTVSITPQVGTSSVASQDDKVNKYEYDALLRMKTLRDDQYNILKEYNYSNVPQVPCVNVPDTWIGINPICFTDQTNLVPNINNYSAITTNSYGNVICRFTRTSVESPYLAKINYTVSFTDSTTYSNSIVIKTGDLNTLMGLPLTGKSAESVSGIGIDTVINLSDDYGLAYQRFQNRQRVRDGYTEANTLTGGIGQYVAPVQSATGCAMLFSNRAQTGFSKNDCANGSGSYVEYTVPAGSFTASSQSSADSLARASGQAYANINGNCTAADTSWAGVSPYCITGTADTGTPNLSVYSITTSIVPLLNSLTATLTRTSAEAVHDATVFYQLTFNDGSTAAYTTPIYKNQQTINLSPPLIGYGPNSVVSISITGVTYSALKRLAYTTRKRFINGVADGYQEANTTGPYYLAPIENPSACGTWYYNTPQTGFYRNNCSGGGPGLAVSCTIAAHTDSSMVSQTYADALARARGQVYANTNGGCNIGPYVITYAGNGKAGYIDGSALSSEFSAYTPATLSGITVMTMDGNGNLYVRDNAFTRKITPNGLVTTFYDGTNNLASITGMVVDASGNMYECDAMYAVIRKISPSGVVSIFASSSLLSGAGEMAMDPSGNIYVVGGNGRSQILKVTQSGVISVFAGNGTQGHVDGPVSTAEFSGSLYAICVDNLGNIYVGDYYQVGGAVIRKISNGYVSTLAGSVGLGNVLQDGIGSAVKISDIGQMAPDASGNIYFTDIGYNCIRMMTPAGVVSTLTAHTALNGPAGYLNGNVTNALFNFPWGIAIDASGNIYVSDNHNIVIRKIIFPH
jgi:hypothetical protein